jgi:hypothetical protein
MIDKNQPALQENAVPIVARPGRTFIAAAT